MDSPSTPARAAALLIGNELLTGKIRDENGLVLASFLRRRGIALREISIVPDEIDTIAAALRRLATQAEILFTSGGVGPTHDDVTLAAVAQAFDRPLAFSEEMAEALRRGYGGALTDTALRMASLPAGTRLLHDAHWPVLRLDGQSGPGNRPVRVYVLPGIPALFRAKLDALATVPDELTTASGWVLETVESHVEESRLASDLEAVLAVHPTLEIGSYPCWLPGPDGRLRQRVRVTIEAPVAERAAVTWARDELRRRFAALDAAR